MHRAEGGDDDNEGGAVVYVGYLSPHFAGKLSDGLGLNRC